MKTIPTQSGTTAFALAGVLTFASVVTGLAATFALAGVQTSASMFFCLALICPCTGISLRRMVLTASILDNSHGACAGDEP